MSECRCTEFTLKRWKLRISKVFYSFPYENWCSRHFRSTAMAILALGQGFPNATAKKWRRRNQSEFLFAKSPQFLSCWIEMSTILITKKSHHSKSKSSRVWQRSPSQVSKIDEKVYPTACKQVLPLIHEKAEKSLFNTDHHRVTQWLYHSWVRNFLYISKLKEFPVKFHSYLHQYFKPSHEKISKAFQQL